MSLVSEDGVATTGMGNERRNSILMTRRYPDLGSNSDWLKICLNQSEAQPKSGKSRAISMDISTEVFLDVISRGFLRLR